MKYDLDSSLFVRKFSKTTNNSNDLFHVVVVLLLCGTALTHVRVLSQAHVVTATLYGLIGEAGT